MFFGNYENELGLPVARLLPACRAFVSTRLLAFLSALIFWPREHEPSQYSFVVTFSAALIGVSRF